MMTVNEVSKLTGVSLSSARMPDLEVQTTGHLTASETGIMSSLIL